MKPFLKVMLLLGLLFASTFILAKTVGIFDVQSIHDTLSAMQHDSPWWVGPLLMGLLFADLFIAVPTLSLCILAGYLLGFWGGYLFSLAGITLAGITGYVLSRRFGNTFINLVIRDSDEQNRMRSTFHQHGILILLLSRAAPILPEVSACMAGVTKMKFSTFLIAWLSVNIPYVAIASWSGSVSTIDQPYPAIITAAGLTMSFWLGWLLFRRRQGNTDQASQGPVDHES
jgi:uncharacterized membrane protein YdjX (TVP38/TMEM64 family)